MWASAKEAASGADVVVTCLTDDQSVLDTLQGHEGILAGLRRDAVHICLTTISPYGADQLEQIHATHGSNYVSGPVVGPADAAVTGQLVSYLAGTPAAVEKVKPVCMVGWFRHEGWVERRPPHAGYRGTERRSTRNRQHRRAQAEKGHRSWNARRRLECLLRDYPA